MKIRQLEGYSTGQYFINESGTVMDKYGNVITPYMSKDGSSKMVDLKNSEGKTVHENVGLLVAEIYVHNPDPNLFTNLMYRDGNPNNTYYDNLGWTDKEVAPTLVKRKRGRPRKDSSVIESVSFSGKKSSKKKSSKKRWIKKSQGENTEEKVKNHPVPKIKYYEVNKPDGSSFICKGLTQLAEEI